MRAARVVVVCSQAWVARLVAGALEARALQVRVFASPAEALANLKLPVDLLVCDVAWPGGPGELVGGLRQSAAGAPVPVLCLVPDEPSGGRLAALQAGVDMCLAQPFRVGELVAQVEALLGLAARLSAPPSMPPLGAPPSTGALSASPLPALQAALPPLTGPRSASPPPGPPAARPPSTRAPSASPSIGPYGDRPGSVGRPTAPASTGLLASSPSTGARPAMLPPRPSAAPPSTARSGPGWAAPSARRAAPSSPPPANPRSATGSSPSGAGRGGASSPPASSRPLRPALSPASPRAESPPPAALEGDLAHVSLATVLSLLEMERRSGVIAVDDGGRQAATIDLCFGSAVGGSLGGARLAPLAVLRHALAWPRGRFRFEPGPVADLRARGRSLGALLIEAMRLADESAAAAEARAEVAAAAAEARAEVAAAAADPLAAFDDPGPAPSARRSSAPARARSPSGPDDAGARPAAFVSRSSRPPPDSSFPPPL